MTFKGLTGKKGMIAKRLEACGIREGKQASRYRFWSLPLFFGLALFFVTRRRMRSNANAGSGP